MSAWSAAGLTVWLPAHQALSGASTRRGLSLAAVATQQAVTSAQQAVTQLRSALKAAEDRLDAAEEREQATAGRLGGYGPPPCRQWVSTTWPLTLQTGLTRGHLRLLGSRFGPSAPRCRCRSRATATRWAPIRGARRICAGISGSGMNQPVLRYSSSSSSGSVGSRNGRRGHRAATRTRTGRGSSRA